MYYNTPYTPAWHFMMPPPFPPPPRRRRRGYGREPEFADPIAQLEYWEASIKKLKESFKDEKKKDDKKPPSGWEQIQMFMAQISIMIVFGYPMGLLFIKIVEGLYK